MTGKAYWADDWPGTMRILTEASGTCGHEGSQTHTETVGRNDDVKGASFAGQTLCPHKDCCYIHLLM